MCLLKAWCCLAFYMVSGGDALGKLRGVIDKTHARQAKSWHMALNEACPCVLAVSSCISCVRKAGASATVG